MSEKNFIGSKMNKSLDERLVPQGEYRDALNIRVSTSDDGGSGAVHNEKGNEQITTLEYDGSPISANSVCIGSFADSANETIYWWVTDPENVDLLLSYNTATETLIYHLVSTSVLNFDANKKITGVALIDGILTWGGDDNPPRSININRTYPQPVAGVDQITDADINLIVNRPIEAPELELIKLSTKENYLEDKFVSFAYRYKYKDGQYSAMSEFTNAAFFPGKFGIDYSTYEMSGMRNIFNAVNVTFNTGSSNVIGVDVCFKLSDSNVINIIERFNKADQGWGDNNTETILFDNKKIYTTLPESEILRRYDNVPHKTRGLTLMGNRLVLAGYTDGYDVDTVLDYDLELVSQSVGASELNITYNTGLDYDIDPSGSQTISASNVGVDLTGLSLLEGSILFITINLIHNKFTGDATYDSGSDPAPKNNFSYTFTFPLNRDYVDSTDLITSTEFINAISENPSSDTSLTDLFTGDIIPKSGWSKADYGITSIVETFRISQSGDILYIQVPALRYSLDSSPSTYAYEYFNFSSISAEFIEQGSRESLHSNRDFEVAIEYMDDYGRCTTALVDDSNTVFVAPEYSDKVNFIRATVNHLPPSWATRYRFLLKPSKTKYETIYSNLYFQETKSASWWFKLDGDNINKAAVGDILYVKTDSNGATNDVVRAKILDIKAKEEDFITEGDDPIEPAGVYMNLKPNGFYVRRDESDTITEGNLANRGSAPSVFYPADIPDPDNPGDFIEYKIPAGSSVRFAIRDKRGESSIQLNPNCGSREYRFYREYTASQDYNNLYEFIVGDGVDFSDATNNPAVESSDNITPTAQFLGLAEGISFVQGVEGFSIEPWILFPELPYDNGVLQIQYQRGTFEGKDRSYLVFRSGNDRCNSVNGKLYVTIEVNIAGNTLVFETEPEEANPDTYFESSKSYPIVGGFHTGGTQNQTGAVPAKFDLEFFDCYSFGNGVESYKIGDNLTSPGLVIGSRVSAVSEQDFKEADRYADLTYSGVYNEETNTNKLNEFNLGLVNYKPLERVYGPIQKIDARKTDILVLQEDKVSYVLAGKNLLSDAAAGGAITSVPEVLGTQISRLEDHGISHNPESYTTYGLDTFFTDAKRNSVIRLTGGAYNNEQMTVISQSGMREYFRDLFRDNFNGFKIGGYDHFNQDYILSSQDPASVGSVSSEYDCGFSTSFSSSLLVQDITVNLAEGIGAVGLSYNVTSGSVRIVVNYNGVDVVDTIVSGSGSTSFPKDTYGIDTATVTLTPQSASTYTFGMACIEYVPLTVVTIVNNEIGIEGMSADVGYYWTSGSHVSPSFKNFVPLTSDGVVMYKSNSGNETVGVFPEDGSSITVFSSSKKQGQINFNNSELRYLVSNTEYKEADIATLLPLTSNITPTNLKEGVTSASFTYSNPTDTTYLYLVWDFKGSVTWDNTSVTFDDDTVTFDQTE